MLYLQYEKEKEQDPEDSQLDRSFRALSSRWSNEGSQEGSEQEGLPRKGARMKVGDLVRLKHRGNGQPGIGIIYERATGHELGPGRTDEFKCLWDDSKWNSTFWFERELEVINEGR